MIPAIYSNARNNGFFPALFNDIFNDAWLMPQTTRTSTPAINVSEDDNEYKVEVAAPGMTKDDFHITLSNDEIAISMEKKTSDANNSTGSAQASNTSTGSATPTKYLRHEFSYSKFEQRFTLPENVDQKNIAARMTDGVLCIDLPKMKPEEKAPEAQCIEIK